jgi:hypothetical protein
VRGVRSGQGRCGRPGRQFPAAAAAGCSMPGIW